MKLTCAQMDVLISFYIDGDLSPSLKTQVEEHMSSCSTCRAKYDIIKSMLTDLKNTLSLEDTNVLQSQELINKVTSQQYRVFRNNLSAYIDNELSTEENIKIKKFTINNPIARKDLEENYNIRRLMNDSFKKVKSDVRQDFSKNVLKQIEIDEDSYLGIHPAIKLLIVLTLVVLIVTSIVLMSLSV